MARASKQLKKKIASLSALGAGTLVFGLGKAEAGVIYSGVIDAHVGFTSGNQQFASNPMGANSATFSFARTSRANSYGGRSRTILAYGCGCLNLARQGGLLQLFAPGATWGQAASSGSGALVGGRNSGFFHFGTSSSSVPFANTFGHSPFSNLYAQFTFTDLSGTYFGWIDLSYAVSPSFGSEAGYGPELTIHSYAFEDTGQVIATGDTGASSGVPEPGTLASTGLAALALGATGLRKWRKNRKAA